MWSRTDGSRLPWRRRAETLEASMRRVLRIDEPLDPSELRFRTDSVPAGAWVTFIVCAAGVAYVAGWHHAHETALALLIGAGALGGGVILALPWERIVRSRH